MVDMHVAVTATFGDYSQALAAIAAVIMFVHDTPVVELNAMSALRMSLVSVSFADLEVVFGLERPPCVLLNIQGVPISAL